MARIATNTNESIFQIKRWMGVNEAPEGEARLRQGEAAVMRNFKVTPGGALRKRGGSENVAGLLELYKVLEGESTEVLRTEYGVPSGSFQMYPRAKPDSVGNVIVDDEAATVNYANAAEGVGKYCTLDGKVYKMTGCQKTPGSGDEVVPGGAVDVGELTLILSGLESNLPGEGNSGAQSIEVYSGLQMADGQLQTAGTAHTEAKPAANTDALGSEALGGYMTAEGVTYRYHGAKTVKQVKSRKYKKYACTRSASYYSYYSQSGWIPDPDSENNDVYATDGWTSWGFNSSTGEFYNAGSHVERDTPSGTLYRSYGSWMGRAQAVNGAWVWSYNEARGPYTGTSYSYTPGEVLGTVLVEEGKNPEAELGYKYQTTSGGYKIMADGQTYYAYKLDSEDTTEYVSRSYGFYGYPLTAAPDRYDWSFRSVHAEPNESTDNTAVRGIWSGFVGSREVLCAACNGYLWELKLENGVWSKTHCGEIDTKQDVTLFGFDEKLYILAGDDNNRQYKVWDGTTMEDVEGYRPLVVEAATPAGKGTEVERANLLTGAKRMRFSPDGTAKVFQLPEKGIEENSVYVKLVATGENMTTGWTADTAAGTVTFEAAPEKGDNCLEIGWTSSANGRDTVTHMRYMELYNGAQDSRVFLYGDGTNRCIYSGLDSNGQPRADYFPDYNVAHVGEANTPITAMIRHYNKLLAFKLDSAWSISYDTLSLADGRVTAAFMITPVNRSVGNCAPGQAVLVENQPRTLDGRSVMEWKAGSNGSFTGDERNAQRVSQRVDSTIRSFDLETAKTFYDKVNHEYYVIGADGTALVNGIDADAWYIYTDFAALCMINYKDELYFGTADGYLRHFTENVYSDNGEAIDCYWESGSMPFERDYMRKYSAMIWVGIKPEEHGYLKVTAETDRKSDFAEYSFSTDDALSVPKMHRIKLKAKKFTYYKLVLQNKTADTTATVVSADVRVRNTGYVR